MTADRHVAVVPGDDAAPEAVDATMSVLEQLALPVTWTVLKPGESLTAELADASDTVLFGSSNGHTGGLMQLRFGWGTYANVRPVRYIPGVPSSLRRPDDVDYVIVHEALEDVYAGIEGPLSRLAAAGVDLTTQYETAGTRLRYPFTAAGEGVYGIKIYTREGVERVARFAAALALRRKAQGHAGRVTIGGKWNVNPGTDGFFHDVARAVIEETPGVACDSCLADDLGRRFVMSPEQFDVVLLPNLLGDVLSDVGAGTVGGLGMAPSGGYGDSRAYFEPVHGSAPDIAGRNVINPTATLLSAAMMLDHLGLTDAAQRLDSAVRTVISAGDCATPDLGGTASTGEFARAVAGSC
ncbi:isocitrate/isopropylmalate family dehydrogenase [Blastococcus sp. URHD0036]|uniref:isocitrate/isopropylmalate family dehydrogenase n=1 Tax=Blastococcus sp. URHD0036 TaxID=1380356 RepID=UPI000497B2C0|nr:isocitrate/isopropylmalate family dehydrogenase [Blastococcus sp. URHD0036]